jgi:hypothetical protein
LIREVVSLQCSPLRGRERFRHFASGFHGNVELKGARASAGKGQSRHFGRPF